MTRVPLRAPALAALLAALSISLPVTASATTLIIQFTGLDLVYDVSTLCDLDSCNASNGNPLEADALTTMTFGYDTDGDGVADELLGILTEDIWADVQLGVFDIPVGGGTVLGSDDGYFDLLMISGFGISLKIEEWEATYLPTDPDGPFFFFGSGVVDVVSDQNFADLPFDVHAVSLPASFSFSSQIGSVGDNGEILTGFTASGTGEVAAEVTPMPEPGTAGMLGLGLLGLAASGRRRAAR